MRETDTNPNWLFDWEIICLVDRSHYGVVISKCTRVICVNLLMVSGLRGLDMEVKTCLNKAQDPLLATCVKFISI